MRAGTFPLFALSLLFCLGACAPAPVAGGPYGPSHVPSKETYARAERGEVAALEEVGIAYCNKDAETSKADAARALAMLKRAAKLGSAPSALFIAQMYDLPGNCGVAPDNSEMLHWNIEAAKLGSGYAAQQLGVMYSVGFGHANDGYGEHKHRMAPDLAQSYFWYKVSAANDYLSVFKDYAQSKKYHDDEAAAARGKISARIARAMDKKAAAWLKKYPQHAY